MNQSLINKRFEYLVHSLEERSEKNVQQNLYEYLVPNIQYSGKRSEFTWANDLFSTIQCLCFRA